MTSWIETCAPFGTTMVGLISPAMRNVSSGLPAGLATTAKSMLVSVKVIRLAARSMLAPAGT